ncbi:hypothetical protein QOZ80_3AG0220540 [Eleusine coracana subsp. coracana]|nr:hypothetical protein QOZ80_3AG0220540 [Eleusine coracana subsp. coracana]
MRSTAVAAAVVSVLLTVAGGAVVTNPRDERVMQVVAAGRSLNWENGTQPCLDWDGVGCDLSGRVVGISARRASFNGTLLEDAHHHLPALQLLDLRDNNITGPLPSSGLCASTATRLDPPRSRSGRPPGTPGGAPGQPCLCHQNFLTGTIDFIVNFPNVKVLLLDGNSFAGTLPDFRRLPKLKNLSLGQNQVTGLGPLPEFAPWVQSDIGDAASKGSWCRSEPGPCADDVVLLLSIAAGFEFPASLAAVTWKGNNPCAGWLGVHCDKTGATITGINLCRLELNGTIDPVIGGLRSLRAVVLAGNHLAGAVPATISRLTDLLLLDVSDNQINGSITGLTRGAVIWADQGNTVVALSSPPASLPTATIFFVLATFCYSLFMMH